MKKNQIIKSIVATGILLCLTACKSSSESKVGFLTKEGQPTALATETAEAVSEEGIVSGESVKPDGSNDITIYVCGAVASPGVYTFRSDARMAEAIEAAGGMLQEAATDALNLAQYMSDGQMIRVPFTGEESEEAQEDSADRAQEHSASQTQAEEAQEDGRIDLNHADKTALMTIPGVGESKAAAIIAYREEHGLFKKIEDLMQISGIKEASFEKMKPYICVR